MDERDMIRKEVGGSSVLSEDVSGLGQVMASKVNATFVNLLFRKSSSFWIVCSPN